MILEQIEIHLELFYLRTSNVDKSSCAGGVGERVDQDPVRQAEEGAGPRSVRELVKYTLTAP